MEDVLKYLEEVNKIAKDRACKAYLVGGAIRDSYLARKIKDIDIVINQRVEEIARFFADKNKASYFTLDESRAIFRVVVNDFIFDFAQISGGSIQADLKRRDFTINALALPLEEIEDFAVKAIYEIVIDPCAGRNDLVEGLLRATNDSVFKDDPLRLWRIVRLKSKLNFAISPDTIKLMEEDCPMAAEPAAERIRAELLDFFSSNDIGGIVEDIEQKFNLFSVLIPEIAKMKETGENQDHQEDAWQHCLQVLKMLEKILLEDKYAKLINKDQVYLLKIAALLHDIGKLHTKSVKNKKVHYYGHEHKGAEMIVPILKKLKFSKEEIFFIRSIVANHMRPMLLYIAENLTDKGRNRFFREVGDMTPVVLLHSLADKLAAMKVNQGKKEMDTYCQYIDEILALYEEYKTKTKELFLSGQEIIDLFSLEEGPLVGKVLDKLTDLQALGKINNKEEAISYLENYIKDLNN